MHKTMTQVSHFFKNLGNNLKKINKNTALIIIAVVGILIVGGLVYANQNPGFALPTIFGQSDLALAQKAVNYINDNGLSSTKVSLTGTPTEASGLVKFKIQLGANSFDSYVTKDGKLLLAQAFDMSASKTAAAKTDTTASTAKPSTTVTPSDNPTLDAFVVARCPFGLQMQRAMAEAIKGIPELAKYMTARYIGSVSSDGKTISSMHGDAEGVENLRQICIREEQPTKYWNYVSCQMKATGTENSCATSTGVDTSKLSACVSDTSRGVAYAQKDFALDSKYSIQGSPTLILNGAEANGDRSANGVKETVCSAFKTKPSFCSKTLSTAEAATSFSDAYSSGNTASTGSAGCATAQ